MPAIVGSTKPAPKRAASQPTVRARQLGRLGGTTLPGIAQLAGPDFGAAAFGFGQTPVNFGEFRARFGLYQ